MRPRRSLAVRMRAPYRQGMYLLDTLAYGVFCGAASLTRRLPYAAARDIWRAVGAVVGRGLRVRRRVVRRQIAGCFPEMSRGARRRLELEVYDNLGRTLAEILCAKPHALAARVRIDPGWEIVDGALAGGRGAIIAAAHLGNFELGGRVIAKRYNLLDVVKPLSNRRFDNRLQSLRRQHGIGTVAVDGAAPAVLRHLRSGGLVSLLLDQDAGSGGVRIPFLGCEASAWPGAARFSIQTGCPVIPMGIIRQPNGDHVLHIGEPILPHGLTSSPTDVRHHTEAISAAVEAFIRLAPAQWFWVHRRWKGAHEADGALPALEGRRIR